MSHVPPARPFRSVGGTSFAPDEQALYLNYDTIAASYSGWSLSEIQSLTPRQRRYWMKLIQWKRDKAHV